MHPIESAVSLNDKRLQVFGRNAGDRHSSRRNKALARFGGITDIIQRLYHRKRSVMVPWLYVSAIFLVIPWHELIDMFVWVFADSAQDMREPFLWIDIVELGGFDETVKDSCILTAFV